MRQCDLVLITNNSPLRSLLFVPWTTNVCIISLEDQAEGQLDIVHWLTNHLCPYKGIVDFNANQS